MRSLCTAPASLCFFAFCQDVPFIFFFRLGKESLSETPGGAIIALLVVSTEHGDNVSWANERQRREAVLTSIDPCKKEAAVEIRLHLCKRKNIIAL